ncbi:hypothetical protein CAPTEDRAFT_200574 [Capitella teleta]|uniref:Uncharacterized protein n=1 Tax=Capitella teleta TaxID=283909 RepID=R7T8Y1_CAPTE|nr:hypothetical protein CAPTEDRAFT_200574 [Capitella teleta]|eukprot:ELT89883.1 hypothetical protein CAPTEDRAFT_200574 [Capitella teleta]
MDQNKTILLLCSLLVSNLLIIPSSVIATSDRINRQHGDEVSGKDLADDIEPDSAHVVPERPSNPCLLLVSASIRLFIGAVSPLSPRRRDYPWEIHVARRSSLLPARGSLEQETETSFGFEQCHVITKQELFQCVGLRTEQMMRRC